MFPIVAISNCFNARHGDIVFCGKLTSCSSVGSNLQDLIGCQFGRVCSRSSRTRIVNLFSTCSPSAIARLIVAVIVDTIQCQFWWAFAHVGQKVLKRTPSFADRNASTAIVEIKSVAEIIATLKHGPPRLISAASFTASRMAMSDRVGHGDLRTGCWVK